MCSVVLPLLFFWAAPVETTTSVEYIVQVKIVVGVIGIVVFSPLVFWLHTWDLNTCLKCHSGDHSKESNSYEVLQCNLNGFQFLCDRLTLLKSQETQDRSKGERNCQEQETQRQADWKVWRSRGVVKARQGSQKQMTSFLRCFPGIVFTGKPPVNRDALEI